jgi:hypothetical protein
LIRFEIKTYSLLLKTEPKLLIHKVIRRTLEAGLVEHWKMRTWVRMKQEANGTDHVLPGGSLEPLTMDNLQGAFYLCSLLLGTSVIAIAAEMLGVACSKTRVDSNTNFGEESRRKIWDTNGAKKPSGLQNSWIHHGSQRLTTSVWSHHK